MFPWIQTGEVNQVNHPTSAVPSFIIPDGGPMVDDLGDFPYSSLVKRSDMMLCEKKKNNRKGVVITIDY